MQPLRGAFHAAQRLAERVVLWFEAIPVPGRFLIAGAVLALGLGYALSGLPWAGATFLLTVIVFLIGWYWYRKSGRDPFHPMVFPVAYVTFAMLAPAMYMAITGKPVGHISTESLHRPVVVAMLLTTLAWLVGSLVLLGATKPRSPRPADSLTDHGAQLLVRVGRWLLAAVLVGKVVQAVLASGERYGVGLAAGSATGALTTVLEGLFLVAILVIVVARLGAGIPPLGIVDWVGFFAVSGVSLVFLSSRGELIAPAIVIAWGYTRRRKVGLRILALISLIAVAGFIVVGNVRSPGTPILQVEPVARALVDTSSPYLITDSLTGIVPAKFDFEYGSTYLAALKSWPPGVISHWLNGGPPATGTYVYRDLMNLTDPTRGVGFSLPSEGYLNFGMWGVFFAALIAGMILSLAYGRSALNRKGFFGGYAYPVLVAAVPYGLRSDALSQFKTTVYPIVIFAIILAVVRLVERSRERKLAREAVSGDGEATGSSHGE